MPRVKSNVARLKRKNKVMKLAKGYWGGRSKPWKAAIAIGVLGRALGRFLGRFPELAAPAPVALGELHHFVLALQARDVAFDARHAGSLRLQQALEAALGVRHQRRLAQVALPLGMLGSQVVALVGAVPPHLTGPRQPDTLPQRALRFHLRHCNSYFGARTIDMLRPSSFGSCSILPMSFNSSATRSSTSRPNSMWAICRPRYIIVTFTLLPSARNSRACRVLKSKS